MAEAAPDPAAEAPKEDEEPKVSLDDQSSLNTIFITLMPGRPSMHGPL